VKDSLDHLLRHGAARLSCSALSRILPNVQIQGKNAGMGRVVAMAWVLAVLVACSSESGGGPGGTGGAVSKGGSQASGGVSTGGAATGGASSTGGSGSGGSVATGGRSSAGGNSGGTPGTGGGVGGNSSHGGATGNGGATATGGSTTVDAGATDALDARADSSDAVAAPDATGDTVAVDANVYQPCPTNGDPCKIMPYGDSITWGVGDEGNAGYRGPLFALAVAAQQKITFTGSLSNGPTTVSGQTFPKKNEGHSGWTIDGIAGLMPTPALATGSGGVPNIILLMIGTNDVYAQSGQAQMATRLGSLLDKIITNAPDALIVVAKITPLSIGGGYPTVIPPYNNAIPGLVQERAAKGKHVVLGDMNTGFNASTMLGSDGIHPNTAGYKFMADHWYSVIGSLLPK
jgi:lysophospholipase L1-like esterase